MFSIFQCSPIKNPVGSADGVFAYSTKIILLGNQCRRTISQHRTLSKIKILQTDFTFGRKSGTRRVFYVGYRFSGGFFKLHASTFYCRNIQTVCYVAATLTRAAIGVIYSALIISCPFEISTVTDYPISKPASCNQSPARWSDGKNFVVLCRQSERVLYPVLSVLFMVKHFILCTPNYRPKILCAVLPILSVLFRRLSKVVHEQVIP